MLFTRRDTDTNKGVADACACVNYIAVWGGALHHDSNLTCKDCNRALACRVGELMMGVSSPVTQAAHDADIKTGSIDQMD